MAPGVRVVRDVHYWTGLDPHLLKALVDELVRRLETLGLKVEPQRAHTAMDMAVLVTTLALNYLHGGECVKR